MERRDRNGGGDEPPQLGLVVPVAVMAKFVVAAAMTDETIEEMAARYADAAARDARESLREARDAVRRAEEERAAGAAGPFGFPTGLAAAAGPGDDPRSAGRGGGEDPISAATRNHPRVRALYEKWFGGPAGGT